METHLSVHRPVSGRESLVLDSAGSAMRCIAVSELAYHRRRQRLFNTEERRYRQASDRIERPGCKDRVRRRRFCADTALAVAAGVLAWGRRRGAGKDGGASFTNRPAVVEGCGAARGHLQNPQGSRI